MPNKAVFGASRTAIDSAPMPTSVDHVIVSPSTWTGAPGDTIQMSAVAYDAEDNALPGRSMTWASSDPTIATVSLTGLVTALADGATTITATSEGKTGSSSTVWFSPLAATLSVDFLNPPERSMPAILVDDAEVSGEFGIPRSGFHYDYVDIRSKTAYPSNDGLWRQTPDAVSNSTLTGSFLQSAGAGFTTPLTDNYTGGGRPIPGARVFRAQLASSGEAVIYNRVMVPVPDAVNPLPDQDGTGYKRSCVVAVRGTPGVTLPVGAKLHVELNTQWFGDVLVHDLGDISVTEDWHVYGFDITASDVAASPYVRVIAPTDATRPLDVCITGLVISAKRADPVEGNRLVPGFWDERNGALIQNATWNAIYPSDDPPTSDGAGKSSTAIATCDSADYYAGNTVKEYILTANRGRFITMAVPAKLCRKSPSAVMSTVGEPDWPLDLNAQNTAMEAWAWGGMWFETSSTGYLPADGELEMEFEACTGVTVNGSGVPTAWTLSGIKYRGLLYRDDANAPTTRPSDNATFYRARIQLMQANEHYKFFMPRLQNPLGVDKTVRGTRFFAVPEGVIDDRNSGWHDCWVPKETRTGPDYNGGAFMVIQDITRHYSVHEGFVFARIKLPYAIGDMITKGIGKRDFWQNGPYGSAFWTLFGALYPKNSDPTHVQLELGLAQGISNGYKGFDFAAQIPIGALYPAANQAMDVGCAWQMDGSGVIKAKIFLGLTPGTDLIVYKAGSLPAIYGQVPSFQENGGTDWSFLDGGGDTHMGLSDRDRTGCHGGYEQKLIMGPTVNMSTIELQLAHQVTLWGTR